MIGKNFKTVLNISAVFVLMLFLFNNVYASQYSTSEPLVSVEDSPFSRTERLESVAVSPTGWFALSFSLGTTHYVNVYNSDCQFQNCLSLYDSGAIHLDYNEISGNLIIYSVRRDLLIEVDENGSIIQISPCENESEIPDPLQGFTREIGGQTYQYSGLQLTKFHARVFTVSDMDENIRYQYLESPKYNLMSEATRGGLLVLSVIVLRKIIKKKQK